jgi:hypothetical protein
MSYLTVQRSVMLKQIFDMIPDGIIGPFSIASIAAKQQMNTSSETIYLL